MTIDLMCGKVRWKEAVIRDKDILSIYKFGGRHVPSRGLRSSTP